MNAVALFIYLVIVLTLIGISAVLINNGTDGWGWFLFVAVLFGIDLSIKSNKEEDAE